MTDALVHRGPDGSGHWTDATEGIALGHRRLSIIDLSNNGHQPMTLLDRYVITFNGEIYNYLEIKKSLLALGHHFRSESDTEVLLVAYHEWGKDCLKKFDGMFAFAIYDRSKKELFCARDRFGEKPFYYAHTNDAFSFGSEMKAIFTTGVSKSVNSRLLFLYLKYDVVENPHDKSETFYSEIKQLPAAHWIHITADGTTKTERYWDLNLNQKVDLNDEQASEKFLELFDASIRRRMRSDVPTGASLSGGVDSSSIVSSILHLFPETKFNTFTARFNDDAYDEGKHIELLKKNLPIETYYCYPDASQIIDDLDTIFYHQEEPFGSTSIIAQWEVMKLARENNVIVLLDGQGADETLGGYFKYFLPYLHEIRRSRKYHSQLSSIENHLNRKPYLSKVEKLRMLSPKTFDALGDVTRKYRGRSGSDLHPDLERANRNEPSPFHRDVNLNAFLYHDIFNYGLGKLLRFSDRNAMAHSVEVRLPYLSHELVEFAFSLSADHKIRDGWTKRILRSSMESRVPKEILYRRDKKGFQAPSSWLETKQTKDLIGDSVSLLQKEHFVSAPQKSNHWKYIMSAKLIQATNNSIG